MGYKSFVFILLTVFSISVKGQITSNKVKYTGAGIVIGGLGGFAAHKIFNGKRGWTWAGVVGSGFAAGFAKEYIYDRSRGFSPESENVLYTTLGSLVSGLAVDLIYKNNRRRGGGKNFGYLVTHLGEADAGLPFFFVNGSRNLTSEIQAFYLFK